MDAYCPNCGNGKLAEREGYSGDGMSEARVWQEYLQCMLCGARTDNEELQRLEAEAMAKDRIECDLARALTLLDKNLGRTANALEHAAASLMTLEMVEASADYEHTLLVHRRFRHPDCFACGTKAQQ